MLIHKLKVEKASEIEKPQILEWHLERDGIQVVLYCRDEEGYEWIVARITSDGKLFLTRGTPDNYGLQLDSDGHILIEEG